MLGCRARAAGYVRACGQVAESLELELLRTCNQSRLKPLGAQRESVPRKEILRSTSEVKGVGVREFSHHCNIFKRYHSYSYRGEYPLKMKHVNCYKSEKKGGKSCNEKKYAWKCAWNGENSGSTEPYSGVILCIITANGVK